MFIDKMSSFILRMCREQNMSRKTASELCGISPRHFGSLARGQTNTTLNTLEKLYAAFGITPNEMLGIPQSGEPTFRTPMQVVHLHKAPAINGYTFFAVCPRCSYDIEREYQVFCSNCGQKLDWNMLEEATVIE